MNKDDTETLRFSTCWGRNSSGQADAPEGTYKTVTASGGPDVDEADGGHSCAVATDGTITCWGPSPTPEGISWSSTGD